MSSVEVTGLTKRFGEVTAVDQLTLEVGAGEIVGLLGANGAGKTTTMRMILGLLAPSLGSVTVAGSPVRDVDRITMGYVPQGLGLYRDLTVVENVEFVAAAYGVDVPSLQAAGLSPVAQRHVGTLALGWQRRVAFLVARCHRPEVLILDEPTSGVGPLGRARLWETIHETADSGVAVLVSTHHMDEAEECDRIVLMAEGREIATGTVREVIDRVRSVSISGELPAGAISEIRRLGGKVLVDNPGWRVVGIGAPIVRDVVGDLAVVDEVQATFEEAFVALSS